jgi:sulfite exporter TauE/SafE
MAGVALIPVLLVGLFGSVHCGAMCGGIVAAFSTVPSTSRPFPVAVAVAAPARVAASIPRVLAYNAGRLTSYALAGALAAGLAGEAGKLAAVGTFQQGGYWLANLMLIALGLYLMGAWRGLEWLELAGQHLWRHLRPAMQWLLPLDSPAKMLGLGLLWGWLPCGMVYSMLVTAMLSGSAASGAAVMLAFGLGTLPMVLALGLAGERLRGALRLPMMRRGAGLVVLGFGLVGLARAATGVDGGWLGQLCVGA